MGILRNNRGMTLVEVMMAIALFGILLSMFASVVRGYYSINNDNLDYIRMAELARAEMELIKATATPGDVDTLVSNGIKPRAYPPTGTRAETGGEQTYYIQYNQETVTSADYPNPTGNFIKIAVALKNSSNLFADPNSYILCSWLPSTAINPTVTMPGAGAPADPYLAGNWISSSGGSVTHWLINEDALYIERQHEATWNMIIYYDNTFPEVNYTANITYERVSNNYSGGNIDSVGIAFKDVNYTYIFCMTGRNVHSDDPKVSIYLTREDNTTHYIETIYSQDTDFYIEKGLPTNVPYKDRTPTYSFHIQTDDENNKTILKFSKNDSTTEFTKELNISLTNCMLGIYDNTSNDEPFFTFPESSTSGGCDL